LLRVLPRTTAVNAPLLVCQPGHHARLLAAAKTGKLALSETHQIRRLHWGCGDCIAPGWINCDIRRFAGIDIVCDIFDGLPLDDDSIDYISAQHVLPEIKIYDQVTALRELRRVLKTDGVLRLSLPDLDKAIAAYQDGRREYFLVYDWETIDGNFITQIMWYNISRTLFTYAFAEELLRKADFTEVRRLAYRTTTSAYPEIVELDNRPEESFYVEAFK
jgi:SAM-dependent methyltransferase